MKILSYNDVENWTMSDISNFLKSAPNNYQNNSSLYNYIKPHIDDLENYQGYKGNEDIFVALYKYFKLNFKGKSVIDLGPGSAESILLAKKMGAKKCYFIDRDPLITRFTQLLGFTGWHLDYSIERINISDKIDYLIAKGSINSDQWTTSRIDIPEFIKWMESFAQNIIITPTYQMGDEYQGLYYHCVGSHREKYLNGPFHNAFINAGYEQVFINGYSHEIRFPFTYVKFRK